MFLFFHFSSLESGRLCQPATTSNRSHKCIKTFYSLCINSILLNCVFIESEAAFVSISQLIKFVALNLALILIIGNGWTGEAIFYFIPDSLYDLQSICSSDLLMNRFNL